MNSRSEAAYDVQYCPKRGTQLYNWISRKHDHELPGWKRGYSLIWGISEAWHHMMVRCRGTLWIHYWLIELDWKKGAWFMGRSQICTCGRASRRAWNPYMRTRSRTGSSNARSDGVRHLARPSSIYWPGNTARVPSFTNVWLNKARRLRKPASEVDWTKVGQITTIL